MGAGWIVSACFVTVFGNSQLACYLPIVQFWNFKVEQSTAAGDLGRTW